MFHPTSDPRIEQMPDGRILVHWEEPERRAQLSVILTVAQLRALNSASLTASLLARAPIEEPLPR